jgi:hypothetical protein
LTSTLAFWTAHFCVHTCNNNNNNKKRSKNVVWETKSVGSRSSTPFTWISVCLCWQLSHFYIALTMCKKSSTRTYTFHCRKIPILELTQFDDSDFMQGNVNVSCTSNSAHVLFSLQKVNRRLKHRRGNQKWQSRETTNNITLNNRSVFAHLLVCCVILLCIFTFWVPCCDVR